MATKKGSKAVKVATEEATPEGGIVFTQLATRIPKVLHKAIKLYCAGSSDDESMMEFVVAALEDRLAAKTQPVKRARK